ncbi:MAG: ABC transporter ATP-binding protein [Planctomycetota bacterium]
MSYPVVIEGLTKHYGRRVGVDSLSFSVPRGSIFGFLGPNGSGKTTTIRVLMGFLQPTRGRATAFGRDCWRESDRIKANVGYLPGDLRLYPWLTGVLACRISGEVRRRDLMAPGSRLAEQFGLDMDLPVRAMSRGTRQKLGLLLALTHEPALLILDEPAASLDPIMQGRLHRILRERAACGCTVILSSHTLGEIEELCDQVAIMREGRLVAHDTLDNLRARAARTVVIRWSDGRLPSSDNLPACLRMDRQDASRWFATLHGSTGEVVRWAAGQPIEELTIGPPSLADVFQSFYE